MPLGAFTSQFDLPLLLLDLFFVFFLCLVYYLRQEDKREGYPLDAPERRDNRVPVVGFPPLPKPKTFIQPHGREPVTVPRTEPGPPIRAEGLGNTRGLPIRPLGDPLTAGVGPGAWMPRADVPDLDHHNEPVFRPLREATAFRVMKGDSDPRGFAVLGTDKRRAGIVTDVWVDRSEHSLKFFEVELDSWLLAGTDLPEPPHGSRHGDTDSPTGGAPAPVATVLLPEEFASVNGRRHEVRTGAITAAQFARVPRRKLDTVLTALEEEQLRGYFGAGYLYAEPHRQEPLL